MTTPATEPDATGRAWSARISVLSVPVSDQELARAFYEKLGFVVVADNGFDGQRWLELQLPGSPTTITLVTWFPQMPPGGLQGVVLAVTDLESMMATCAARGVGFDGDPQEAPWGRFSTVTDPDGNSWVVKEQKELG